MWLISIVVFLFRVQYHIVSVYWSFRIAAWLTILYCCNTLQQLLIISQVDNNGEALASQGTKGRIWKSIKDITIPLQIGLEEGASFNESYL